MLKPTGIIHNAGALHEKNPVLQVIGQQRYPFDSEAAKETQQILNAYMEDLAKPGHRGIAICSLTMDVFLLGMIYGKRAERQRRKRSGNVAG